MKLDLTSIVYRIYGFNFNNFNKYDARIAAIDYIFVYDDGISLRNLDQVQVILFGVFRCGKIFISLYLVMQFGIRAVNYFFIVDDMDNLVLFASFKSFQYKLFGLIIDSERLAAIREERRENSRYVSFRQCRMEVAEVEVLYRKNQISWINSINYSVEEIVIKIFDIMGFSRRMYQRISVLVYFFVIMLIIRRGVIYFVFEISSDWFIVMRIIFRQFCRRSNKFLRFVMNRIDEFRIARIESLVTFVEFALRYFVTFGVVIYVIDFRRRIEKILNGEDKRLLVIIGFCSIYDFIVVMEYVIRLQSLRNQYQLRLEIVMRIYFEKLRIVVGWKGLIFDLDLNGSYRVNYGLELARKLFLQVNELGVLIAIEFFDMVIGQFIVDLISWGAIGVRIIESQIYREMVSVFFCSVGFKNGIDGNTRIVVDVIRVVRVSYMFFSLDKNGQMIIYQISGNSYGYIIMRGGKKSNYYVDDIVVVCDTLYEFDLFEYLVVDFSYGNCQKQYRRQLEVCEDICQ